MKNFLLILVWCVTAEITFAADILTLNNSKVYHGKVTKIKDCSITFKTGSNKYQIPSEEIYSIEFENVNDKIYTRYLDQLAVDPSKCVNGRLDAAHYHGKKSGHIALGFLFGPFAMLGTSMSDPTPEKGQSTLELSEHSDLFNDEDYLSCYKKKAKGKLIGAESIGFGITILMVLLITPTYLASK